MSVLRNWLYYRVKPFVPQSLRTAIRRKIAERLRSNVTDVWPIIPGSEGPPDDWLGWPEGKKFALVLTHDVESAAGVGKCRELMRLEMESGLCSSFNFIPEGSYRVPRELRDELVQNGFEVGIHDLRHDGRLFASRRAFNRRAARINEYLRQWKAVGFRSGFMFHELDWLHKLDIEYDTSTFDTDPFEPQPEGRHTIFPFWVPAPATGASRTGYVELPYTLPQDSTLFLLLRESTIDVWRTKLDWVAQHGGMALVNVHPDYLSLDGSVPNSREYPFTYYESLLDYVTTRYQGLFWNKTPKELARFFAKSRKVLTGTRA